MKIFNLILSMVFAANFCGCDNQDVVYAPKISPIKSYFTIGSDSQDELTKVISFVVSPAPKNATERKQAIDDFIATTTREFYGAIGKHKEIYLTYDLYEETEDLTENFEPRESWNSIAISPDSGEAKEGLETYGKGHRLASVNAVMFDNCKIGLYARAYTYLFLFREQEKIIIGKNEQLKNCQVLVNH